MKETVIAEAVTRQFLEGFLPPWDKIKDIKVTPEVQVDKETKIFGKFPQVCEISVKVEFENPKKRPVNLIIRTPITAEETAGFTRKLKYFHKELFFHDTILREFKRLQSNCESEEKNSLKLCTQPFVSASVSDACDDPLETFIALTDLRPTRKFQKASGLQVTTGLDFNHAKLVIREIAKLHALSWVYRKSKAVLSLEVLHPVIQETRFTQDILESFLSSNVILMILSLPEVRELFGEDSEPEMQLIDNLLRNGHDVSDIFVNFLNHKGFTEENMGFNMEPSTNGSEDHEWAVGSHGDLRTENLQFKYDLSKDPTEPVEVALLNFNCYRECCPTIDLAYFFYTSVNPITRLSHCQDLLEIYHENFMHFCCTLMKKDPYPGFNLESLTRKFNQAKIFGLLSAICLHVLPTFLQSQDASPPPAQKADSNKCDTDDDSGVGEEDAKSEEECWTDSVNKNSLEGGNSSEGRFTTDLGKEISHQGIS